MRSTLLTVAIFLAFHSCLSHQSTRKFIDLTHEFNNETVPWPGRVSTFKTEFEGYTPEGIWVASRAFCTSEHTSTHMDAPYHFAKNGKRLNELPLEDMIDKPAVMIDIYDKVHRYENNELKVIENYVLTKDDVLEWEAKHGPIPYGAVVFLRTGWDSRWPDLKAFRGEKDSPDKESEEDSTTSPDFEPKIRLDVNTNFPGYDASAAKFLAVERQVVGVGIDCLSIDPGNSRKFPAHVIFASRGIWMLEMVANLHMVPPRGFNVWVVPFKIDFGTGAPTRVLARLNE